MYYNRTLSTEEALFVSRAQQKIAELSAIMAEESSRNDVNAYNAELCVELEYVIGALRSNDLAWTADEIRMVTDYYTLTGNLVVFAFRSVIFNAVNPYGGEIWATVPQLREVETNSINYDAYLLGLINQEIIDRADYDAYLLSLITVSSGAALTAEIISDVNVGAIRVGDVFPIGTLLEDIWKALLGTPVVVSNFTFNSYTPIIEVGDTLAITQFTWDITGTPINMTISDSEGQLVVVSVSGISHSGVWNYSGVINEDLTWTISADNMDPVTITVLRRYVAYYGKEATATDALVTVTEAKILAGTPSLQETAVEVTISANTSTTEQGFIAVPKAQTVTSYTAWFVNNTNFSDILSGEFISPPVDVLVSGITYEVYRWGYRSPLTGDIKLHR